MSKGWPEPEFIKELTAMGEGLQKSFAEYTEMLD